jgi:AcrR family transcriptional regulator
MRRGEMLRRGGEMLSSSDDTSLSTLRGPRSDVRGSADAVPAGGGGALSREEVEGIQRARILSAMIEVAAAEGYIGAAVAPVVARAGVSRSTFYELFEGREDCFLAAFEWGISQGRQAIVEAYGSQRSWRDRVRHALAALLGLLDAEPELARVCVIEALEAGRLVLERRARVLDELIAALDAGALRARGSSEAPLLTGEGIVGGAFSVIHGALLTRPDTRSGADRGSEAGDSADARPLISLHGQLMALIVLPYLGPSVAGEELMRVAPELTECWTLNGDGRQVLRTVRGL